MNNNNFEEFLTEIENDDKEEGIFGRWVKRRMDNIRKEHDEIVKKMIENEKRDRR